MSLTTRRKRPLDRGRKPLRDARLIIIATEGSDTERIYFDRFGSSRVQVRTLASLDGKSSPDAVLSNLETFQQEYQLGAGDELWVAIDVDRWHARTLGSVATRCVQKKYGLAISNPCFEIWLALHLEASLPNPINARSLERHLRKQLGKFRKGSYDAEILIGNAQRAIANAKALDSKPRDRWPQEPGSRVYRLVQSIIDKLGI